MAMEWKWTDGYEVSEFAKVIEKDDSYALADNEKQLLVAFCFNSGSKTLTLGYPEGQVSLIYNFGSSNAVTVKNVSGDSGTSVAAGKVALVKASATANGSKVVLLN